MDEDSKADNSSGSSPKRSKLENMADENHSNEANTSKENSVMDVTLNHNCDNNDADEAKPSTSNEIEEPEISRSLETEIAKCRRRRARKNRLISSSSSSSSASLTSSSSTSASTALPQYLRDFNDLFGQESPPHPFDLSAILGDSDSVPDRNDTDSDSSNTSIDSSITAIDSIDSDSSSNTRQGNDNDNATKLLASHPKPPYNYSALHEIMNRENGLCGNNRYSTYGRNDYSFQKRFTSALHTVEKIKMLHTLKKHEGCVNSINFNKSGDLLVSGSDDLKINVWDWAGKKIKYSYSSGHISNVFQTKFIGNDMNIVSSSRDGQVRLAIIPPSGGKIVPNVLLEHNGAVHKICSTPQNPYEILTAAEDGHVILFDLRGTAKKKYAIKGDTRRMCLYSIAHHPFKQEFCVSGRSPFVHVYDKRSMKKPLQKHCPKELQSKKSFLSHVTCAVYNSSGTEILASYSDDDIYLFSEDNDTTLDYTYRYKGHKNRKTIKGVNFFGPDSEYVASGSDCGNLFFWEKKSQAIVNWLRGDKSGVINCLEPHPSFPVLATSGLDHDVKIWMPISETYPPVMKGLEKCVAHNMRKSLESDVFNDRRLFYFIRSYARNRQSRQTNGTCPRPGAAGESLTSDDDSMSDEDDGHPTLGCSPQ